MGMPVMGTEFMFICPMGPLLPFMCTILYAAGFPWGANCCCGKELFLARVPEGQPFMSEDWYMGAV